MIDRAIEMGTSLPEWFLSQPILLPGEEFYLNAFMDLSGDRSVGMGPGPIPWTVMVKYAQFKGIDEDFIDYFTRILRIIDSRYIEWQNAESEKRAKQQSKSKK